MSDQQHQPDTNLFRYRELTGQDVADYHAHGYLRYGRTLNDEGLERLRDECMIAWKAQKQSFDPDRNWLENSLLTNIHHLSQTGRRYYFRGPLVDVAEKLIGPNIKGATTQLTFKLRGNTMPFGWHQDNAYGELDPYNGISTLTALDDADEENGCLWLIPGSHHNGQAMQRTQEQVKVNRDINLEVDDSKAVPMPMKAGEALIFHCWMLHRSEGNRSKDRDRRIYFMRYADADAVEVYNDRKPRLGPLLRGATRFPQVEAYEAELRSEKRNEGR